ncbi:MAG: XVIPCD domain-containing protein [Xanthomonas sp.]
MSPTPTTPEPGQATDASFASSGNQFSAGPYKRDPEAGSASFEYSSTAMEAKRGPLEYALVHTGKVGAGSKRDGGDAVFNVEMEFTQGHRIGGAFKAGRLAADGSLTQVAGERGRYEVKLPGEATADAAARVNPFDPTTIPEGGRVRLDGQVFAKTSMEAAFRGFATSSERTDAAGMSYAVERLDADRVRVAVGPTQAVERLEALGLKTDIAQAMVGRQDALGQATMRTATFDLREPQAQAAYRDFLASGRLAANAPGVGDVQKVESLTMSSETRAQLGLGPLKAELGGQRNTGENVRTTYADGSSSVVGKVQYAGNVPMTLTRQFDAAGNERLDARTYQFKFDQVDKNQAQLLNSVVAGKAGADAPIKAGQDVTLGFSERQMDALRQQYQRAAQSSPMTAHEAADYAKQSPQDFAIGLARHIGSSKQGLSEQLFRVADRADGRPGGDLSRIDAKVYTPELQHLPAPTRSTPTTGTAPDARAAADPQHQAMQQAIERKLTPYDANVASNLLLAARRDGLTQVDHVLRNDNGRVFAVQGDPTAGDKRVAYVDAAQAATIPAAESARQLAALPPLPNQAPVQDAQEPQRRALS